MSISKRCRRGLLFVALCLPAAALGACQKPAEPPKAETSAKSESTVVAALSAHASDAEKIASAMSAAPPAISQHAAIVDMSGNGMRTLREGTNGFSCMADALETPGPDPMCVDANAMAWLHALMAKTVPAKDQVGFIYMLQGGTDASNTDPFAKGPTANNNWIKTGPHVMITGASKLMSGYPRGPNPDTSAPFVMWPGTPYEHLMIPTGS